MTGKPDTLMVQSVAKAFKVLEAFDAGHASLSLTQVAAAVDLDKSAAQRFTHTLTQLGYLQKNPETKHFQLTSKALQPGYNYTRSSGFIERATPYLMHLSLVTEETVNLTVRDGTEIVFVSRFLSRHVLNPEVMIGTRLPAYCTAPGIAMLSQLPLQEAEAILNHSNLRQYTPTTTWRLDDLMEKIRISAERGYATAFEEYYYGDLSVAAASVDSKGRPICAVNVAVSRARLTPDEAEEKLSSLVTAAAASIS